MKSLLIFFTSYLLAGIVSGSEPDDISSGLKALLENFQVPGVVAAAVQGDELIALGSAGIRKQGDDSEVEPDDKFHIGSCTKSMTATLAAILVEGGEIEWNTTVAEVFNEVDVHDSYQDVTLQQLLTNTGGTPGDVAPDLWRQLWTGQGDPEDQRMQLVEGTLTQPSAYPPGTKKVYSNSGFAIAGAMLEVVTRKPYEKLLTKTLFDPLSMNSAGFRAPARNGKVDQPYGHHIKAGQVIPIDPEPQGDNPIGIAPAGAVHCSIADFANYAMLHLGTHEEELISETSLEHLHTPTEVSDYALGWITVERDWAGGKALTHSGSNTMFKAVIWLAPEKEFAAIVMCNLGGEEADKACSAAIDLLMKNHLEN